MEKIWGNEEYPSDWALDKLISRLREKLGDSGQNFVKTMRGSGITLNQ